jgi:hypothetical protein
MSAAALTGLLGNLAQQQQQLPLQYGNMYQSAYAPGFNYFGQQANNMTNLGQAGMGLYGNLAGQQASMYQSELPIQMEAAMFNSLAPALSGLLGQSGLNIPGLGPLQMNFNRPDVMGGYQGVMDSAYNNARGYDSTVGAMQADMMDKMPVAPYLQPQAPQQAPQQAPPPAYQSPLMQRPTPTPAQMARQTEQQNFKAPVVGSPEYKQRASQQLAAGQERNRQRVAASGVQFKGGPNPNNQFMPKAY